MAFFITGVSGFIGFHLATALLARGEEVIGIDIHTHLLSYQKRD
ncbi:NAD-dependent epimerase/dehydratase family protein [Aristophania vespae]|uniref:NAD-dependent epimerase/dehydratase family protein n=1 Tax=Aristophania vespae TaxID=2697033 RepID=A0A6P1NHE7_9PROT|nr:NAD-dependent epimerase/dehydratase family protein [Aristophania vespae]